MSILSDYYNHYSRSTILLQTVTSLTKFYGKDYAGDFFAVIRHIGDMALLNLEYNDESYVRELMQLFAVVPVICCSQLNRDTECVSTILRVSDSYIHTAPTRGKMACFSLLNRLLRCESDNENILIVISSLSNVFLTVATVTLYHL